MVQRDYVITIALPHDTTEPVEFSDKVEDLQLQVLSPALWQLSIMLLYNR